METSELYGVAYNFAADQEEGAKTGQVHQGGTSSGKTYSILQVLFTIAAETEGPYIITVVGQDIPNLKSGALRDALNIYDENPEIAEKVESYNRTDRIFTFTTGWKMEFKSYETAQKAKSGKRQFLFMNEANGISWDIFNELQLRCISKINSKGVKVGGKWFIDYNPNAGFWAHEQLIGKTFVDTVISDHRVNPFIPQELRDKIERIKQSDVELWKVYGRGLTGRIEGMIFSNWSICEAIPAGAKFIAYGLDFGFTNDETGFIEVYLQSGQLWVNELIYETGLTNQDISKRFKILNVPTGINPNSEIVADSAEPKSIEELRRLNWRVMPAAKGPDSIKAGIDILKRYHINVTRVSVNLRRELERYTWKKDKSGVTLNEPVDLFNHLIDPLRYVALNKLKIRNLAKPKTRLPYRPPDHNAINKEFNNIFT